MSNLSEHSLQPQLGSTCTTYEYGCLSTSMASASTVNSEVFDAPRMNLPVGDDTAYELEHDAANVYLIRHRSRADDGPRVDYGLRALTAVDEHHLAQCHIHTHNDIHFLVESSSMLPSFMYPTTICNCYVGMKLEQMERPTYDLTASNSLHLTTEQPRESPGTQLARKAANIHAYTTEFKYSELQSSDLASLAYSPNPDAPAYDTSHQLPSYLDNNYQVVLQDRTFHSISLHKDITFKK